MHIGADDSHDLGYALRSEFWRRGIASEACAAAIAQARAAGIPADVPGSPELCDFYLPALLRRGGVVVGVSAGVDEKKRAREIARELSGRLDQILPGPEADHRE